MAKNCTPAAHRPYSIDISSDGIHCTLQTRSIDRNGRSATYDLTIDNGAQDDVAARIYMLGGTSGTREFGVISAKRGSGANSIFSVPLEIDRPQTAFLEIFGGKIDLSAELLLPRLRRRSNFTFPTIVALGCAVVLPLFLIGRHASAVVPFHPVAPLLNVDPHVVAGVPFTVRIAREVPGLRVTLKDSLGAVVASKAAGSRVEFTSAASRTVEAYRLVAYSEDGAILPLERRVLVYPR